MQQKLELVKDLAYRSVEIQIGAFRSYDTKTALLLAVFGFLIPAALKLAESIDNDGSYWWGALLAVLCLLFLGVLICFASFFARERQLLPKVDLGVPAFGSASLEEITEGLCNEIYSLLDRGRNPIKVKELCLKTASIMLGISLVGMLVLTFHQIGGTNG